MVWNDKVTVQGEEGQTTAQGEGNAS